MRGRRWWWGALGLAVSLGATGCTLFREPAPPPFVPSPPRELPTGVYTVEVASLSDAGRAQHLRQVLAHRFPDAFVSPLAGGTSSYYRVRIGPYPLRTAAVARAEMVNRLGYPAIIVEESP